MTVFITEMEVRVAVFNWIKNQGFNVEKLSISDLRFNKSDQGNFQGYEIIIQARRPNEKENMVQGTGSARMVPKTE